MNLSEWIESGNFQFKRINERPWGGYELAASTDGGVSWVGFQRPFGSRWSEQDAFHQLLTEMVMSDILRSQLIGWLGENRVTELKQILHIKPNVPEHIHNQSNE